MSGRQSRPAASVEGVQFPLDAQGSRPTGTLARDVVAEALSGVDPTAADRVRRISDWRKGYIGPFTDMVGAGVHDPAVWDGVARTALHALQSRMVAVHDEAEIPMTDYLAAATPSFTFGTETVRGTADPVDELTLPYRGELLRGASLRRRLDLWVSAGVIEPSCAAALTTVQQNPEWLRLPGRSILVLGLGSEMGPASAFLRWGADVLGIDLASSPAWERYRSGAAEFAGTLRAPVVDGEPGADLLTQLPELAEWIRTSAPAPVVVGTYLYADGGTHVRLSSASDALAIDLLHGGTADSLAYLATPMDTFVVPEEVRRAADTAFSDRRSIDPRSLAGRLSGGRVFGRNYQPGAGPAVHDALVPQQGPNYTLAKRVQRWRATTAFNDGHTVSITVAPATRTRSVVKNAILASTYKGAPRFGIEIFEPDTSSTMLAALVAHDLYSDRPEVRNQWEHESAQAASGGLWRQPYLPRTALPVAALIGTVAGRGRTPR